MFCNVLFNLKMYSEHFAMIVNIFFQQLFSNFLVSEPLCSLQNYWGPQKSFCSSGLCLSIFIISIKTETENFLKNSFKNEVIHYMSTLVNFTKTNLFSKINKQVKNLVRKVTLFFICANTFNVWLKENQMNSISASAFNMLMCSVSRSI